MSAQPFAGIRIVEFGQFIAVPFAAQLLSEGGAHVIKVESLEGDPTRHLAPLAPGETRHFISRNRGKHSLPLYLKHPAAAKVMDALVGSADIVLTNFRPGLAHDLGLDYATLSGRYPRLIVGNVTAFGHLGPDAGLAGMDLVMQARSGLMVAAGKVNNGIPQAADPPLIDYMCAMMLSFGLASALFRRERTGRGGEVDVALLMAALTLQNNSFVRVEGVDGPVHADVLQQLAELRGAGAPFAEQAAVLPSIRTNSMSSVYYRSYATKDAAIAIACVSPSLQRRLMAAVGLDDAAHRGAVGRAELPGHYAGLQAEMETLFALRTTAEWQKAFESAGVPASSVKFPIELANDPQVTANGFVHDLDHPSLGPVHVLAPPVRMDGEGFVPAHATAAFATETHDVLAALGFNDDDIDALISSGVTRWDASESTRT
ncbi:MAG: CaiB/BaiF CoA transferase family protein [Tepidiformaceae bacterium]